MNSEILFISETCIVAQVNIQVGENAVMLPAGAITVVGKLRLHVLQIILLLQRSDFVRTSVQMFEAFTQALIVCRRQNKHRLYY